MPFQQQRVFEMPDIAKMVKAMRDKGISQTEIAKEVKCDQSTISRIENGQYPSYLLGKRIEEYYAEISTPVTEAVARA